MFPFINRTDANFLGGKCPYDCLYCWVKDLCKRYKWKKYSGAPWLDAKQFNKKYSTSDFVFLCDCVDWMAWPIAFRQRIVEKIKQCPAKFLSLTKDPNKYWGIGEYPKNLILGATIESNRNYPALSKAPLQTERLEAMTLLRLRYENNYFVAIEPILDFDLDPFVNALCEIAPWSVAVGYDNWNHHLPEPSLEKTLQLITRLEKFTTVYRKTLRDPK